MMKNTLSLTGWTNISNTFKDHAFRSVSLTVTQSDASCVFEVCLLELRTGCLKAGDIIRYMDISRRLVQCAPESFYDSYTPVTSKEWQNKIPLKKCTLDTPLFGAIESRNIESDNIHADILSDIRESTLLLESTLLKCDTKCLSQECQFLIRGRSWKQ